MRNNIQNWASLGQDKNFGQLLSKRVTLFIREPVQALNYVTCAVCQLTANESVGEGGKIDLPVFKLFFSAEVHNFPVTVFTSFRGCGSSIYPSFILSGIHTHNTRIRGGGRGGDGETTRWRRKIRIWRQ